MHSGFKGRKHRDRSDRSREPQVRDERLMDVGRITGELLHDLGGILSLLAGRVALAREKSALGRIPNEELERIQGDTDELRSMVLDILDEIQGIPSPMDVTFPISPTVEEAMNRWLMGAPSVNARLRSAVPDGAEVAGPRTFCSRALGNLLRNAARHAKSEIKVSIVPGKGRNQLEIRVEDDGDGVPPEVREHLFEPFVSQSKVGAGLGLSFARWGVERLGGSLEFKGKSESLGGAFFQVLLPLVPRPRRTPLFEPGGRVRGNLSERGEPLSGLKVAVVDDNEGIRRLYTRLLNRCGADASYMDPAGWRTLSDALRDFRKIDPDVILLDVNLGGLSGPSVERALAREMPQLAQRVIFMTGGLSLEGTERPVVNKVATWDEVLKAILAVTDPTEGAG